MTPFADIYKIFLSNVTDYQIKNMIKNHKELELRKNLQKWMVSGLGYFITCRKDLLDYDLENERFNVELDSIEKNIVAKWMVYEYLNTKTIDDGLMKQQLNPRDYRVYSAANQISAIESVKNRVKEDGNSLMSKYFYKPSSIKELFNNEKS